MHRDKTVARILLILSVVHVAAAAPAIVRQRSLDVDEDVTAASEKRGYPGDTSQDLSPVSQMGNQLPTTSGIPPSQDNPPPESGTAQLHNDQPQTSGPSPSQDDTSPASGDPQSHNGPPAGSNDPQLQDAPSQWRPGDAVHGESLSDSSQELDPVLQMNNDPPPASGTPQLDDDWPPASGTSQLDNNWPSALGTPQLDNDPQPASGASQLHNDSPLALGTAQLHDHSLTASETSSVHDDPESFDGSYRFNDIHYAPSSYESGTPLTNNHLISYAPPSHESETPPTNSFLSDETKDKLKNLVGFVVATGAFYAIIFGSMSNDPPSQPFGRDLTNSSDVVGRGVSTLPRLPRKLVSRALANLRNEDLRLLSVLNGRALERLV